MRWRCETPPDAWVRCHDGARRNLRGRLRGRRSAPGDRQPASLSAAKCPIACRSAQGDFGFTTDCVAQCENLLSIDLAQIDFSTGPLGSLDEMAFRDVIKAIGYVMESDCEPV